MAVLSSIAALVLLIAAQSYSSPHIDNTHCEPIEEGDTHVVECGVSYDTSDPWVMDYWRNDLMLQWFSTVGDNWTLAGMCTMDYSWRKKDPRSSCRSLLPNVTIRPTYNSSVLTVRNVSRLSSNPETRWTCRDHMTREESMACMEIYAKAAVPTCDPPVVNTTTRRFTMRCKTKRVYPRVGCQFLHSLDNINFSNVSAIITYIHTEQDGTPPYFEGQCTLSASTDVLGIGWNYLKVLMFPTLRYSEQRFGVSSDSQKVDIVADEIAPQEQTSTCAEGRSDTSLIVIGLGVALALITCVALVLAVLVIRQWRKEQRSWIPPHYDRVTPNQPCQTSVYLSPERNVYITPTDPTDSDYEVMHTEAGAKATGSEYDDIEGHSHGRRCEE